MQFASSRRVLVLVLAVCLAVLGIGGCAPKAPVDQSKASAPSEKKLPDSAYSLAPGLETWIDPDTGYDTTREWKLDGGEWPIAMLMSPSQAPQAIVAEREGLFDDALAPFGITPSIEKMDLPPRTFHAMQRSKWPFAYVPLAVFTDYVRGHENQGDAGGLQYVALAGSTAGGGYTMLAKDPAIKTVADLAGKSVAQANSNPVPGTLLAAAAKQAGLKLGDGKNDIHLVRSTDGNQLDEYEAGEIDAIISLNITKAPLLQRGSHPVTDFSDVDYTPNYTILIVERSVLEQKPEVVEAFLEAHYEANKIAVKEWDTGLKTELMDSWNAYFEAQNSEVGKQRIVPHREAFDLMLGNMYPEQRIDPRLLRDCWAFASANDLWGWDGTVDVTKLSRLRLYDDVLKANGEKPQAAASK